MVAPSLLTPNTTSKLVAFISSKFTTNPIGARGSAEPRQGSTSLSRTGRRDFVRSSVILSGASSFLFPICRSALAASDEEYVKETAEVINKVRSTVNMDKSDPNVASAVAALREASNSWVAKYRKEKALLARVSFRDMYSALNAVSGHYISFGPTAPIPAKRKARILEEMDTAEKALLRGR
ncbi:photosystem II repair protein PSB27-H1, chloroplastic-like [Aristolochia californica]|uniref:photosystem II repair protein PSB27-H1, chloroplastic-like n=1 Tax=Aristolochia californica TaxID=171875 RepID=UPI0035E395D9